MSNHPPTPSRVSRYVPPPGYGGGGHVASDFQGRQTATSSAPFSPASFQSGYSSSYSAAPAYQIPSSSYIPAPFQDQSQDRPPFMSESRERSRHQTGAEDPYQASYGSTPQYGSHQTSQHFSEDSHTSRHIDNQSLWARSMRLAERDSNARGLFIASACLMAFSLIQMLWALVVESHALFASSFWSLYMSMTLGVVFLVQIISRQKPSESNPYGYGRFEIVASFTNGSLIVFAALYVLFEGSEGLLGEEHAHEAKFQLALAIIGIIMHAIFATLYPDGLAPRTETASGLYSSRYVSSTQLKVTSLITHLIAPVCVLIASITGSSVSDGIIAVVLSLYMLSVGAPLCWRSGRVLVQAAPMELEHSIERSYFDIGRIAGVIRVDTLKSHFWTFSPGVHVGTVVVVVEDSADDQFILTSAQQILKPYVYHLSVQVCLESHAQESHDHDHHGHDHDHHHDHDHDHHDHNHDHGSHSHSHSDNDRHNHNHGEQARYHDHGSHSQSNGQNTHNHDDHNHDSGGHNHNQPRPDFQQLQPTQPFYQTNVPYSPQSAHQGNQGYQGYQQTSVYGQTAQHQQQPYYGPQQR